MLDSLLQNEDINIKDNRGRSLLHWAVGCDQLDVVDFLLSKNIDFTTEDNQKKTPMHVALERNSEMLFTQLQALQPTSSWVESYGTSLLQIAILNQSEFFVNQLIELGLDVNRVNERGSTPLEIAKRIDADTIYTLLLSAGADPSSIRTITLSGPYMGQQPPGKTPKMFAPNFISTEEEEFGSVFNSAGTEFFFAVNVNGKSEIRFSSLAANQWTTPVTLLSHERYGYNDPFLSPEEDRLYFISDRALDGFGESKDIDIWFMNRTATGWSEPINAGQNINTPGNEYYISFTQEGNLYFSSNGLAPEAEDRTDYDIYSAAYIDSEFDKPVNLGEAINTVSYEADVFVSPDESYVVFCSTRDQGVGQGDLYVSFKEADGNWTPAINLGKEVNTANYEYCPYVSPDGKYLFFTSNQDIYWVSTEVLFDLK